MKRYIILFAILITAIFYYPVFAYAGKTGLFFVQGSVPQVAAFLLIGSGLLSAAGLIRKYIQEH
ncbi:MAG: hypothetical protein KKE62_05695 [Proteobacteria bacterium]|nr:hypothetical protein [Pseudomonadota bacterium]MBU1386998.1 hypothetical protein [Pseudomonadota bacterium]MBU1542321.1 hypothetical protein [Pseudomonadota bacterium]MBU2481784.1 hypothetical protein [Pseudomonadota bacterium]